MVGRGLLEDVWNKLICCERKWVKSEYEGNLKHKKWVNQH